MPDGAPPVTVTIKGNNPAEKVGSSAAGGPEPGGRTGLVGRVCKPVSMIN